MFRAMFLAVCSLLNSSVFMFVRQKEANSSSQMLHLPVKRLVQPHAGRVLDGFRPDRNQRGVRRQPPEQCGLVEVAKPKQPIARDLLRQIAMLQGRPDHLNIGLEDAENGLVAGLLEKEVPGDIPTPGPADKTWSSA